MSSDETVRFQFNLGGIDIDISGQRSFVDEMYRELMRDLDQARQMADGSSGRSDMPVDEHVIWIHRCSDMMRKIYMAHRDQIGLDFLSTVIDPAEVHTMYVDKHIFESFLPQLGDSATLWAELTAAGRRKINQESRGSG